MDRLALTGAELAFILSLTDEDRRSRAQARLRLRTGTDESMLRDGLGSLVVRGLAQGNGDEITLAPPIQAVLLGLTAPIRFFQISVITKDAVDAAQLYLQDETSFLLSPRAYETFEFLGVRTDVNPSELLVSITRRFLGEHRPSLVACRGEATGPEGSVALAAPATGGWMVVRAATDATATWATLDEALSDFAAAVNSAFPPPIQRGVA